MCCFGGPNLDILFVCSRPPNAGVHSHRLNMLPHYSLNHFALFSGWSMPEELAALDSSAFGAVFVLQDVGARGVPEPAFSQYPVSQPQ